MAELQARMSRREFGEWCAYFELRMEEQEEAASVARVQAEIA